MKVIWDKGNGSDDKKIDPLIKLEADNPIGKEKSFGNQSCVSTSNPKGKGTGKYKPVIIDGMNIAHSYGGHLHGEKRPFDAKGLQVTSKFTAICISIN